MCAWRELFRPALDKHFPVLAHFTVARGMSFALNFRAFRFARAEVSVMAHLLPSGSLIIFLQNLYIFPGVLPQLQRLCFCSFWQGSAGCSSARCPYSKMLLSLRRVLPLQSSSAGAGCPRTSPSCVTVSHSLVLPGLVPVFKGYWWSPVLVGVCIRLVEVLLCLW